VVLSMWTRKVDVSDQNDESQKDCPSHCRLEYGRILEPKNADTL
jgi:hypothetical protein